MFWLSTRVSDATLDLISALISISLRVQPQSKEYLMLTEPLVVTKVIAVPGIGCRLFMFRDAK